MPSPEQLRFFIVLVPAIFFLLGFIRPVFAVTGYMIIVYCKASSYFGFVASIRGELLFAVIVMGLLLIKNSGFFMKLLPRSDAINKYLFYLILSAGLSFVIAWDRQYSWDHAVYHFIKTLVLYVMIIAAIEDVTDLKIFVWSFLGMFVFLAYEPLYGYVFQVGGSEHMYGTNYIAELGLLSGHVALANNMNQMIPIGLYVLLATKNKFGRILGFAIVFVFLVALAASGSRGGVVGLMVMACCAVYFSEKKKEMAAILGIVIFVVLLTVGSSIMYTASRIDSTSTQGRLFGLTHGLGMLKKGNLLGVGPGCYPLARGHYFHYTMESHNIYGQIMGDLGLPGMLVTFLFGRQLFRNISSIRQRLMDLDKTKDFIFYLMYGIQISLIVRLAISMASHGLYFFYWYVMAALIVASKYIVENQEVKQGIDFNK